MHSKPSPTSPITLPSQPPTNLVLSHKPPPPCQRKLPKHLRTSMEVLKEATPSFESSIYISTASLSPMRRKSPSPSRSCAKATPQNGGIKQSKRSRLTKPHSNAFDRSKEMKPSLPQPPCPHPHSHHSLTLCTSFRPASVTPIPPPPLEPNSNTSL